MSKNSMKILLSGSSGTIGSAFSKWANSHTRYDITRLQRGDVESYRKSAAWDPKRDDCQLPEADAVIHLAGEPVIGRWTKQKKKRIYESRVHSTKNLCSSLAKQKNPPRIFLCASGIGFYGNRADEELNESSGSGEGFLADVVKDWESACAPLLDSGCRVINMRTGIVLSCKGGALNKMLLPFKLCLGGPIAEGEAWMSWISISDMVQAIDFCLNDEAISGPLNFTAPNPVTNKEFSKSLGRALSRPAILPLPRKLVEVLFGEMAEETILSSARALPKRLEAAGYSFKHKILSEALEDIIENHI